MPSDLVANLEATVSRLLLLASADEGLRSSLHQLAFAVVKATEPPIEIKVAAPSAPEAIGVCTSAPIPVSPEHAEEVFQKTAETTSPATSFPVTEKLPDLTFGRATLSVEPVAQPNSWHLTDSTEIDLPLIESRCRLKAEAARWASTRRRLMSQGASFSSEIAPKDGDLITRARTIPDCFLWMCHLSGPSPTDPNLYEIVASCFENAADLLAMIRQIQDRPELLQGEFEKCLDLLAEAQSALRVSIDAIGGKSDSDQWLIYQWLKLVANENQIFLQHFMRLDDPADPTNWSDLASRSDAVDSHIQEILKKDKFRNKLLGKIRHKASQILNFPDSVDVNWEGIVPSIDELISNGLPPSNVELRELLVPVIETLPEMPEPPRNVGMVFREIDRYLATVSPPDIKSPIPTSAPVQEVARLLKGKSMVVIGGERRSGSYEALKEAFQLRELIWIETREHESISGFEPYIARPDVAVVNLAIRWTSHSHGEVQVYCEKYGKPLVRLPGGYNPNQVAAQILAQCSARLRAEQT